MKNSDIKYFPNLLQAFGLIVLVMLALFAGTLLYRSLASIIDANLAMLLTYSSSMAIASILLVLLNRKFGSTKSFTSKVVKFKTSILIILATCFLLVGIIYPISFLIPISEDTMHILKATFNQIDLYIFLAVVIAAPIFEEFIFRGIILDGLLRNHHPALAIFISSLLFGIFHINPLQITSAFIGGLFIGWIYYKTSNLFYCIGIHFIVNLFGFILLKKLGVDQLLDMTFWDFFENSSLGILIVTGNIILFFTCCYFINKTQKLANS